MTLYPEINEHDKDDGFQLTVSFSHVGWLIIKDYFKFDNEYIKIHSSMANIAKYLSMDTANVKFDNNYEIWLMSLVN